MQVDFEIIIDQAQSESALRATLKSLEGQADGRLRCTVLLTENSDASAEAAIGTRPYATEFRQLGGASTEDAVLRQLKNSPAKLAMILPAGGVLHPNALQALTDALGQNGATLATGPLLYTTQDGEQDRICPRPFGPSALLDPMPIVPDLCAGSPSALVEYALWSRGAAEATQAKALVHRLLLAGEQYACTQEDIATIPGPPPQKARATGAAYAPIFGRNTISQSEAETLAAVASGDIDLPELKKIVTRLRSPMLNVALSDSLQQAGAAPEMAEALFDWVDWSRGPVQWVVPQRPLPTPPLFSIVIATFNAAKDLPDTLRSIQEQQRGDVEVIVVDGGSRDATLTVAQDWNTVVSVCFSQPDRGLYEALNKGLQIARGHLIGIVGAGDCYLPGALDVVARKHIEAEADIYGGQTLEQTPEHTIHLRKDEPWGFNAFISGGPVGHNGMFASRHAYTTVGGFGQTYPMAEDTRWMHRAIRAQLSFCYVPQPVVLFPLTGMSNNNPDIIWQEAHALIQQNFPQIEIPREDALKLLYTARGWCAPEEITPVIARYNHIPLKISLALALEAEGVEPARQRQIIDGLPWREAAPLYAKNGIRWMDKAPAPQPALSIIIPCYNAARYLPAALISILTQDFENYEVVLVDDGSSDHTLATAKAFAALDGRIRLFEQANAGAAEARMSGLAQAKGQYVWFFDADDALRADTLGRIASILEKLQPDAYRLSFTQCHEDGTERNVPLEDPDFAGLQVNPAQNPKLYSMLAGWSAQPWRFIVRRSFALEQELDFARGLNFEDHPYGLKLVARAHSIFVDPAVSYRYFDRPGSASKVESRRVFDFISIRRKCLDLLQAEGLLEKMPALALSYLLPVGFIRNHVPQSMQREFLLTALTDMDNSERALALRLAGHQEFALIKDLSPEGALRFTGDLLADVSYDEMMEKVIAHPFTARPCTAKAKLHPLSRTLGEHDILGLYPIEATKQFSDRPQAHAWSCGRTIWVRMDTRGFSTPHLHLKFRNIVEGQVLVIEGGGLLHSVPCVSDNIRDEQEICLPLSTSEDMLLLKIETAKLAKIDDRSSGILISAINLLNGNYASHLPASSQEPETGPILAGAGADVSALKVDVRQKIEPRPYAIIGKDCAISATFVFERGIGRIRVGDGTSIGANSLLICAHPEGISIGRNTMLSWGVTISDNNSHSVDRTLREPDPVDWSHGLAAGKMGVFKNWQDVAMAPVRIGDGVWIGFGSTIMKGVTIGDGAVIASGTTVTRDVPPYTVVAGSPARIVTRLENRSAILAQRRAAGFPDLPLPEVHFSTFSSKD